MEVVRQFRFSVIAFALLILAILAVSAAVFDWNLAKGVLLGGISGCVVFALWARFAEGVISGNRGSKYAMVLWSFVRLALYGLVLWKGYTYDPEHLRGFMGAVAGLSVLYVVVAIIGYTGWDLKRGSE